MFVQVGYKSGGVYDEYTNKHQERNANKGTRQDRSGIHQVYPWNQSGS